MPTPHKEALARVSAESQKHVMQARESCAEGAAHVRSSRRAIARSFDTLGETSRGLPAPDDMLR